MENLLNNIKHDVLCYQHEMATPQDKSYYKNNLCADFIKLGEDYCNLPSGNINEIVVEILNTTTSAIAFDEMLIKVIKSVDFALVEYEIGSKPALTRL